ncbi:MoaD/ThiS family protein [Saccharopolyspora halophila]|uniref:MoaD/ThiS family protein n=1 Tax=Saccharopolyspora halophila TaxID=405551 RepID=A0ABN3FU17_9PSEU
MTAAPRPATQLAVRIRYFAGARAAAGVAEEVVHLDPPATVAEAITAALDQHDGKLSKVLEACSFLLDGLAVRDRGTAIEADATLDVLPPFAGG